MIPAPTDDARDHLARFLEILAPGENDMVAMIEAYFDESEEQAGRNALAVAGYIFTKERCLALDSEWNGILKDFGKDQDNPLPYFRMSSCAHRNPPFSHLSHDQCDRAARRAISAIKKHITYGLAASVEQSMILAMPEFTDLDRENAAKVAYVWCCWMSLIGVRVWADQNKFDGQIAYFFEAGAAHQSSANAVMNFIFTREDFRRNYRYAGHAFVPKARNRPVQTADLFAWHHLQDFKRARDGKSRRKDYSALLAAQDFRYRVIHARNEMLEKMNEFNDLISMLRLGGTSLK